jgi:hypothetical protein
LETEHLNLKADLDYLAVEDVRYKAMKDWHNRIGDMLAYVSDVLTYSAWIRRYCERRFRGLAPDETDFSFKS